MHHCHQPKADENSYDPLPIKIVIGGPYRKKTNGNIKDIFFVKALFMLNELLEKFTEKFDLATNIRLG